MESLATQTLVIFVIRTAGPPWRSRPSRGLAWGVTRLRGRGGAPAVHAAGALARLHPAAAALLRVPARMVIAYLGLMEMVKRWFYRRYPM